LADICDLMERLDIPRGAFVATHINRSPELLEMAAACGRRGMILDITGNISKKEMIPAHRALALLLEKGVPLENITFSSDSGAAFIFEGQKGILPVDICLTELRRAVTTGGDLSTNLKPLTSTPAGIYKLPKKGRLAVGMDADILLFDGTFDLQAVYVKGRPLFEKGRTLARGWVEEALLENLEGAD
jgi:beta-aspartyl-dipeptidase (metallo-type)